MRSTCALALLCLAAVNPLPAENYLVLPFFNLSEDSSLDWIGESLAEGVREAVAGEGLLALDRNTRLEGYRRLSVRPDVPLTSATVIRLGEVLDADQVIFGSFRFSPPEGDLPKTKGTLRIHAQVIDVKKSRRGPEYTEIGALEDLARLQTHLAWQTLHFLQRSAAPSEAEFLSRRPVVRVEAIENYVRGILAPKEELRLNLLMQAVRIDPRFSRARFAIGSLYLEKKAWKQAADHLSQVDRPDSDYRQAMFRLGLARYRLSDFAGAEEAFRIVAESVPLNEVWNNLAAAQSRLNKPEALANFRKALEGDPADPDYHFNVGYARFRAGDLDAAAERFRAVLDRDPDDAEATTMLGRSLKRSANTPLQRSEGLERLKETYEESAWLQLKALLESRR